MDFHEENLLAGFVSQPKVPTFMGDAFLHVTSIRSPRAEGCLCGRAAVVCDFKGRVAPGCNSELAYTLAHDLKLLHSVLHGSRRDSCFCVPSVLGLSWLQGRKVHLRFMSTTECRDVASLQVGIPAPPLGMSQGIFQGTQCWFLIFSGE